MTHPCPSRRRSLLRWLSSAFASVSLLTVAHAADPTVEELQRELSEINVLVKHAMGYAQIQPEFLEAQKQANDARVKAKATDAAVTQRLFPNKELERIKKEAASATGPDKAAAIAARQRALDKLKADPEYSAAMNDQAVKVKQFDRIREKLMEESNPQIRMILTRKTEVERLLRAARTGSKAPAPSDNSPAASAPASNNPPAAATEPADPLAAP